MIGRKCWFFRYTKWYPGIIIAGPVGGGENICIAFIEDKNGKIYMIHYLDDIKLVPIYLPKTDMYDHLHLEPKDNLDDN